MQAYQSMPGKAGHAVHKLKVVRHFFQPYLAIVLLWCHSYHYITKVLKVKEIMSTACNISLIYEEKCTSRHKNFTKIFYRNVLTNVEKKNIL